MFGDVVVVRVGYGTKQKSFTVHKGILTFYSAYFEAALKQSFSEEKSGIITLDTENVVTFGKFVGWLYTQKIEYIYAADKQSRYKEIFDLWIFADRRQIPLLMNLAIDDLRMSFMRAWKIPKSQHLRYLYDNTTDISQLRVFAVHLLVKTCQFGSFKSDCAWPVQALKDCLASLAKDRENGITKRLTKAELGEGHAVKEGYAVKEGHSVKEGRAVKERKHHGEISDVQAVSNEADLHHFTPGDIAYQS
nr:hypothetical protein CFP56_54485 [Quercus suber]